MLDLLDGFFFTGGSSNFFIENDGIKTPTLYFWVFQFIFLYAQEIKNIERGFFLMGVCLGMEGALLSLIRIRINNIEMFKVKSRRNKDYFK